MLQYYICLGIVLTVILVLGLIRRESFNLIGACGLCRARDKLPDQPPELSSVTSLAS